MTAPRRVPRDPDLYADVVDEAKTRFAVWPSAYASGWVVKTYKERGGKYAGEAQGEDTGLTKWFGEEWVDLSRPTPDGGYEPCGRKSSDDPADYPKCRPLAEAMQMTPEQVADAVRRKRRAESQVEPEQGRAPVRVPTYREDEAMRRRRNPAELLLLNPADDVPLGDESLRVSRTSADLLYVPFSRAARDAQWDMQFDQTPEDEQPWEIVNDLAANVVDQAFDDLPLVDWVEWAQVLVVSAGPGYDSDWPKAQAEAQRGGSTRRDFPRLRAIASRSLARLWTWDMDQPRRNPASRRRRNPSPLPEGFTTRFGIDVPDDYVAPPLPESRRVLRDLQSDDIVTVGRTQWVISRSAGDSQAYAYKYPSKRTKLYVIEGTGPNTPDTVIVYEVGGSGQRISEDVAMGPLRLTS